MVLFQFITPIIFAFFIIYLAIKALDKINRVKNFGLKKQARVINIREELSPQMDDHFENSPTYYFTVSFKDRNGRIIEQEIEFGIHKKPNRHPPFSIGIIYYIDENKKIEIILENNKRTKLEFYSLLSVGILILSFVAYNYNDQIDLIIDILINIFTWKK